MDENVKGWSYEGVPVVADASTAEEYLCREWVDEVFFTLPSEIELPAELVNLCEEMGITVHIRMAKMEDFENTNRFVQNIAGYVVVTSSVNVMTNGQAILKRALDEVKQAYDFVIIDCPPSLNLITINALTAADTVLVPIQCEYFALEGLEQLLHAVNLVKKRLNRNLEIEGIVFTMYDARTNLSLQVVEEVKRSLGANVYRTIIPRNVRLGESPSHGLPIHLYDPKSKGAESYGLLAEEVMEKEWD